MVLENLKRSRQVMEFEELKRVRTLSQAFFKLGVPRGWETACPFYLFPPFSSSNALHPLWKICHFCIKRSLPESE